MAEETADRESATPLAGRSVVVTRARAQAADFVVTLERLGAEVIAMPVIQTLEPEDWAPADAAIEQLSSTGYDWIVFSSANAVHRFADRLSALGIELSEALQGASVAAVGSATDTHLLQVFGFAADAVPEDYSAEGLLAMFTAEGVGEGARVLIPRALKGRNVLVDGLRDLGAEVDVVAVYRTEPAEVEPEVAKRLRRGVDAVTFTSPSTVRNFIACLEAEEIDVSRFMASTTIGSIGPVTTEALRKRGFEADVEAAPYTVAALGDALGEYFGLAARE